MAKRLFLIVLDGLGIGELPDAAAYADTGTNTLAAAALGGLHLPNLQALGLFNINGVSGGEAEAQSIASYARMTPLSDGKDGLVGHWEVAGVVADRPLPTYPGGFPEPILDRLYGMTYRRFICNRPCSTEEALRQYTREHLRTGKLILYTSQDSVMQIAADETMVPVSELYEVCRAARSLMQWENNVGRVIARPYGAYPPEYNLTANRRDFAATAPGSTMLDIISKRWMEVISIGKVYDLFGGRGITRTIRTRNDAEGMEQLIKLAGQHFTGLCFANLSDFDDRAQYGDIRGCAEALQNFDRNLPRLAEHLGPEDVVILTADHGADPSRPGGHTREYVPMLLFGAPIRSGVDLGDRATLADIAATIQEYFGLEQVTQGTSFLGEVLADEHPV